MVGVEDVAPSGVISDPGGAGNGALVAGGYSGSGLDDRHPLLYGACPDAGRRSRSGGDYRDCPVWSL